MSQAAMQNQATTAEAVKAPGLIRVAGSRLSQLSWNSSSNDFEDPPGTQPWICIT
jgi:hypothetical protein